MGNDNNDFFNTFGIILFMIWIYLLFLGYVIEFITFEFFVVNVLFIIGFSVVMIRFFIGSYVNLNR